MVEEGGRRHCFGLLATVELHEDLGSSTCHAKGSFASVDVMASGQEVGSEGRVMQEGLEDDSLITGLSHVPDATSATTRARVLVSIVLNIDLGSRVLDPSAFAIYQMISCSV